MKLNTCPFCSPDKASIFLETDMVFGLWDAFPVANGHALLVPKRHVADWFATSPAEQKALFDSIPKARDEILKRFHPDGFNIGVNVGETAGQTIPHVHVHLIPRYSGDVADPTGGVRYVIPGKANYIRETAETALVDNLLHLPAKGGSLVRGGETDPFLQHLLSDIEIADRLDLAVAFVLPSGVDLIEEHIRDLLRRGGQVRFLTGNYNQVTDPEALQRLLDLDGDLTLRIYDCTERTFHPKAYLISAANGLQAAYVGSSNLTRTALCNGVEWNYRVDSTHDLVGVCSIQKAFDDVFLHPETREVTQDWIENYRKTRSPKAIPVVEVQPEAPAEVPSPHIIQEEALCALEATRAEGNTAGLVVLATGLGKTWLSAFDSNRPEFQRILFVAHREEILEQSIRTFRKIRPTARFGKYNGTERTPDADVLFASVQTLSRAPHLRRFARDAFDYIIVDEFHHAAARTYRKVIDYFEPKFFLGLTATPERTDGGDLLALCQENVVYRCDVMRGIKCGLLSPFHYYGVPDEVDYSNIPWQNSRFDEKELTSALATQARAGNALEQYRLRGGKRALGFCCSLRHADFMAQFFCEHGVRAVAVHSGPTSAPRARSLEKLRDGEIDIVFAVDLFNEGVDLPTVDTVLMLRPTESRIIWIQQFGRGLRVAKGKSQLNVIDYIGNHKGFLLKPQTLFDLGPAHREVEQKLRQVQAGTLELPPGCEVTYDLETIEILRGLIKATKGSDTMRHYYEDFMDRHGYRPLALEASHEGFNPNSIRKDFGSWFGFVKAMDGLTESQTNAYLDHKEFLENLAITPMTKSYKMVLLLAMLNEDAFPGEIGIEDLVVAFRRRASRSAKLIDDVGQSIKSEEELGRHLEKNPIAAWIGARGSQGEAWFEYEDKSLRTTINVEGENRRAFQELVREICDWRLGQYLTRVPDSLVPEGTKIVCSVGSIHGVPKIQLEGRDLIEGFPIGEISVVVDGEVYDAHFSKDLISRLRRPGSQKDEQTAILQTFFGVDAGLPGTSHRVILQRQDGKWALVPFGQETQSKHAELWRSYARRDIAGLFGEPYLENKWRQGLVKEGRQLFLLVTLEKSGMAQEHQYADRFLSPSLFEWQSQNRQARDKPSGMMLRDYEKLGLSVQLFVRPSGKVGSKTAPFYYCGELDFVEWEGDKPITVKWALREAIPEGLFKRFGSNLTN